MSTKAELQALWSGFTFQPAADAAELDAINTALHISLPPRLRALLTETNGISAHFGAPVLFSASAIVSENLKMRSDKLCDLYMPFDSLLFFGGNGGGDLFGFRILPTKVDTLHIYRWDHETDGRECFCYSLQQYFERVKEGAIL